MKKMSNQHSLSNVEQVIEQYLENKEDEPRQYIGASSIGNPCERAIWYGLNYPEQKVVTAKQRLTFEIGRRLEGMIIDLMIESGLMVISPYPLVSREYPAFQGNVDCVWLNDNMELQAIIEIKTAKDSSFNIFKKKGLRLWYPDYYDQIQSYLGMSGIPCAYILVLNKDTSELLSEKVEFDRHRYELLVEKAKRIGDAKIMPPRINGSPSYFRCKYCFYKGVCHERNI